jgi:hypothetical protein
MAVPYGSVLQFVPQPSVPSLHVPFLDFLRLVLTSEDDLYGLPETRPGGDSRYSSKRLH